jgi:hypothetical protein
VKSVAQVRERVLSRTLDMLEHLRLQLAYPEPDPELLKQLERPQQFELAEDIARFVMQRLGHTNGKTEAACPACGRDPPDPRYDKTRRALNETLKQGPRRLTAAKLESKDATG